jgi:hypothetical protein
MDGWFKQEADAHLEENRRLNIRNRTIQMRLELERDSLRSLQSVSHQLSEQRDNLTRRASSAEAILFQIFAADPFLRNFYADDIRFAGLTYDDDIDSQSTEVESAASDEDPTLEHQLQEDLLRDMDNDRHFL